MKETAIEAPSRSCLLKQSLALRLVTRLRHTFRAFLQTPEAPRRLLSVEERLAIAPKKALILVNCDGRRFLLVTAGDSILTPVEVKTPTELRIPVLGFLGNKP